MEYRKCRAIFGRILLIAVILFSSNLFTGRLLGENIKSARAVSTPTPLNLASGKTVTVDSTESSSYPGSKTVDNDNYSSSSQWRSANTASDHWLAVNLGATYNISRVLFWSPVTTYTLQSWNGSAWVNVSNLSSSKYTLTDNLQLVFNDFTPVSTSQLRLYATTGTQVKVTEIEIYESDPQPVFVNQSGYDLNKSKRFTAPYADNSATFTIQEVGNAITLYSGSVLNQVGDFSSFNPTNTGEYVITVSGSAGMGQSLPFSIGPNWIERVSYRQAVNFMVDARCWNGNSSQRSGANAGCGTGVAWRDSHQFSFEIPTLWSQYASNPSAYDRMSLGASYVYSGTAPAANTPDFLKLLYWPVDVYMTPWNGGPVNHTLLKEQLAYFLYAYPDLKDYYPQSVYNQARDYLFSVWGDTNKSRWNWYDITHTADLFQTYNIVGGGKGQFPPGHSIIPNLMMYEVAKREGRSDYQAYFNAAYNNAQWIINNVDWNDPTTTKGQRMSEHVTMEALAYFQKEYPGLAPSGLLDKINAWAAVVIARSNNLWDFRKYSDTTWIIPSYNEPGNVAGFPAAAFAAIQVITDTNVQDNLRRIAMSQIDHIFGRNPANRHFSHDGVPGGNSETGNGFEGVEAGWFGELTGGAGALNNVRGVLDGSLKEASYPYNPNADPGYFEGWTAFNTAWNASLAYMAGDDTEVKIFDQSFTNVISSASPGATIGIQLKAPLNFNYSKVETGTINLVTASGDALKLQVNETSTSSLYFRGTVTLSSGSPNPADNLLQVATNDNITASYGFGTFKKKDFVKTGNGVIPAAPAQTDPVATSGQVTVSWVTTPGATGYKVKYGTTAGSYSTTLDVGNVLSKTITGLTNGTTYYFAVTAYNTAGESANSNEKSATPSSSGSDDIIVDNGQSGYQEIGTWAASSLSGYSSSSTRWSATVNSTARWTPNLPQAGTYNVYVWYPYNTSSATNAKYTVTYSGGSADVYKNQTQNAGQWNLLGTYNFTAGTTGNVLLSVTNATNHRADAVRFEKTVSTLFSDNFEAGTSSNWTAVNGSWGVVTDGSKVFKQTGTSSEGLVYAGNATWTDYSVEAKVKLYDLASTAASGIMARYTDSNNYYLLRLHQSGQLQLYKKINGTFTQLQVASTSLVTNTTYTLKLTLNGTSLTGYLNGVQLISVTDNSLSGGKIGARSYLQTVSIDDVVVTG